jgi:hypothetical protein
MAEAKTIAKPMKPNLYRVAAFLALWLAALPLQFPRAESAAQTTAAAGPEEIKVLLFSDLHFNPFSGLRSGVTNLSLNHPESNWDPTDVSDHYQSDPSWFLIKSALENARTNSPCAVLCLGDFVAHNFQARCRQDHHLKTTPTETLFQTETLLAHVFQSTFTNRSAMFVPVLGNNDTTNDYSRPGQEFLQSFVAAWHGAVPPPQSVDETPKDFDDSFTNAGHYMVTLPAPLTNVVAIVFNSTIFSTSSANDDLAEAPDQITWLNQSLQQAARRQKHVWLLCHIPPGTNIFGFHDPFWAADYTSRFVHLVNQANAANPTDPLITACFCGHTHMDEFKVICDAHSQPTAFIHIIPAISPDHRNNPAYQVLSVDRSGHILDYDTMYLANFNRLEFQDWSSAHPVWAREYRFSVEIRQRNRLTSTNYDAACLYEWQLQIQHGTDLPHYFKRFYTVEAVKHPLFYGHWANDLLVPGE